MELNQTYNFRGNAFKLFNSVYEGRFEVIVETKHGNRYYSTWADKPSTFDEVKEAWKNDRKNFTHIN